MKVNLKDNIWIEGFDTEKLCTNEFWHIIESNELSVKYGSGKRMNILYKGKTQEIPEETAKECVEYFIQRCKYKNYNPDRLIDGIKLMGFNYAQQSILSACDKSYCIIYKP